MIFYFTIKKNRSALRFFFVAIKGILKSSVIIFQMNIFLTAFIYIYTQIKKFFSAIKV